MENELKSKEQLLTELNLLKEKIEKMEKYKAFYENVPLSYQSLNHDGVFLDVNTTWLKTLGYEREEVIGKKFRDFLHPEWKKQFDTNFPAFKKRGYVHDVIFKIKHKEGHFIHISFEGCVGYNADGSFKQTYCVSQDITNRVKLEEDLIESIEREKVLADIIRNSPLAIAFGYPDGSLARCNKAFEVLTGYTEDELKEIKWDKVLTPLKWIKTEQAKLNELNPENNYVRYEKEYVHKSGKIIPVELNVTAKYDSDENLSHFIGFVTDISERKKVEDELEMHRKNLEVMVEERTKELQKKNLELDKAVKVFVGREMLIKELQKKINTLEGKE